MTTGNELVNKLIAEMIDHGFIGLMENPVNDRPYKLRQRPSDNFPLYQQFYDFLALAAFSQKEGNDSRQ